jgi:hypothetical protein
MAHNNPSQKELLTSILAEAVTQTGEIQTQTAAIVAMAADIAAQAADIALTAAEAIKQKEYTRWQNEYFAGNDTDLDDIEAGTHTFPSPSV